jgi:hypothetical protein
MIADIEWVAPIGQHRSSEYLFRRCLSESGTRMVELYDDGGWIHRRYYAKAEGTEAQIEELRELFELNFNMR